MANDILVVADHCGGELTEISYEALGLGLRLAEGLGGSLAALVFGGDGPAMANNLGAAQTLYHTTDDELDMASPGAIARAVAGLVRDKDISLVILCGTNMWMGTGAFLSALTERPFLNFCADGRVVDGQTFLTGQLFGGKIMAEVTIPDNCGIVSVNAGCFHGDDGRRDGSADPQEIHFEVDSRIRFKQILEPEAGDVDITREEILISVGRGIQMEDNLELAEELAEVLGGQLAASRPVVDQGWLPMTRQVGKSGMSVKPKLYVALGISGAPEHYEGMKGAGLVIAVNTDPQAPIFNMADYGIVADLLEITPELSAAVRKAKEVMA